MHPLMPPTVIAAANIVNPETIFLANNVGRICCGLGIPLRGQSIQPSLSAALKDISFDLIIASTQYRDELQRKYTVATLQAISEATGFEMSASFAAICEANWNMMADAERSPAFDPDKKSETVTIREPMVKTEPEVETQPRIKTESTEYVLKDGMLPAEHAAIGRYRLYNQKYTKAFHVDKGAYPDNYTSEAIKLPFKAESHSPTSLVAEASHAEDDLKRLKISREN